MSASAPPPFDALDWDSSRAKMWTARAASLWAVMLDGLPDAPVAKQWPPGSVRKAVTREIPAEPLSDDDIFSTLEDVVLRYSIYPGSPRFMGYVSGAGTIPGAVGDLIAAALNQNVGGWRLSPAATEIEYALVQWFAGRFGLPDGSGGVLVSGGAMANFTCLKAARDRCLGLEVREDGLPTGMRLKIYATEETHAVVKRAADMLGLGMRAVRMVPMDESLRMDPSALRAAIREDRETGRTPAIVVGSAGTVGTGAIDPLDAIADICRDENLWFHVDGAYGGPAILAPDLKPLFHGIQRADSIAFDPHKWLYTPLAGGCALFRRIDDARAAFHVPASYVVEDIDRTGTTFDFGSHGPQWSRPFWALKIWLSLLAHGTDAYAQRISHDVALARYMAERVTEIPELEAGPNGLSICCFRYVPRGLDLWGEKRERYLDKLNENLMTTVQLDGRAFCSNAMIGGHFFLRACIVNFRTEAPDVDTLLATVCELGSEIHGAA